MWIFYALRRHCCFYVLLSLYDEVREGQIGFESMTYLSDAVKKESQVIQLSKIMKYEMALKQ